MLKRSRLVLVHIHAAKELFSLFSLLVIGIGVYQALFLKKLQCNNSKEYIYIYICTHTHTHTHTHTIYVVHGRHTFQKDGKQF